MFRDLSPCNILTHYRSAEVMFYTIWFLEFHSS